MWERLSMETNSFPKVVGFLEDSIDVLGPNKSIPNLKTLFWEIPWATNMPKDYNDFIKNYEDQLTWAKNPNTYFKSEADRQKLQTDIQNHLIYMVWHIQNVLNDKDHYDIWVKKFQIKNVSSQLSWEYTPPEEMYSRVLKSKLNQNERVVCLDFARFSADIFKKLQYQATNFIINMWIQHEWVIMRNPTTWDYFIISADSSWVKSSKIISWKSSQDVLQKYQEFLLSTDTWRLGWDMWKPIIQDGKLKGYIKTFFDQIHSSLVFWGNHPSDVLTFNTNDIQESWKVWNIEYKSVVGKYVDKIINWEEVSLDIMLMVWQHLLSVNDWWKSSSINDVAIKALLEKKLFSFDENWWFNISAQIWTQIWLSHWVWKSSDLIAPNLNWNSYTGVKINYSPKDSKLRLTTSLWTTYELLNPSVYYMGLKFMPSGSVFMLDWDYKLDSKNSIIFKVLKEHYLNTTRNELNAFWQNEIAQGTNSRVWVSFANNTLDDTMTKVWNSRLSAMLWLSTNQLWTNFSTDLTLNKNEFSLSTNIVKDLTELLKIKNPTIEESTAFFKKLWLQVPQEYMVWNNWLDKITASLFVSNHSLFSWEQNIVQHFANLWLTINWWNIFIKEWSSLYNSFSFWITPSISNNWFILSWWAKYSYNFDEKTQLQAQITSNIIEYWASLKIKRSFCQNDSWTIVNWFASAWADIRADWFVRKYIWAWVELIKQDGSWSIYWIEWYRLVFGSSSAIFWWINKETSIWFWISNKVTINSWKTVVNGLDIIWNKDEVFQYLAKDSKSVNDVKAVISILEEIWKVNNFTISQDFLSELKDIKELTKFKQYLEKNEDIFKSSKINTIHFESNSDFLWLIRWVKWTEYNSGTKHLVIRAISKESLTEEIFTNKKEFDNNKIQKTQEFFTKNNIVIKSDKEVSQEQLSSLLILIDIAKQKQNISRIQNLTINLSSPWEQNITPQMWWDATNRILDIPITDLYFDKPVVNMDNLKVSWASDIDTEKLKEVLKFIWVKSLYNIKIIKDDDPNFLTTDWEKSLDWAKSINGVSYIYQDFLINILNLYDKVKESKSIISFDKMVFWNLSKKLQNLSIYPVDHFSEILENEMSDKLKDITRASIDIWSSILYDVVEQKYTEKTDWLTSSYDIVKNNNREKAFKLDISMNSVDTENPSVEITVSDDLWKNETFLINPNNSSQTNIEIKSKYPEIYNVLYWLKWKDISSWKEDLLEWIISKLFSRYKLKVLK